jgi:hypothetical protein
MYLLEMAHFHDTGAVISAITARGSVKFFDGT